MSFSNESTAGPWMTLLHSMSFHCNNEKKKKKKLIPGLSHYLCGVGNFSPNLCGLSLGTPVSSHISKMCMLGSLVRLHGTSVRVWGCACVALRRNGILSRVGSCLMPWATGLAGSLMGGSELVNNYLTFFD